MTSCRFSLIDCCLLTHHVVPESGDLAIVVVCSKLRLSSFFVQHHAGCFQSGGCWPSDVPVVVVV